MNAKFRGATAAQSRAIRRARRGICIRNRIFAVTEENVGSWPSFVLAGTGVTAAKRDTIGQNCF
jgi:hypothetical protein